jgi:hypothetical protein
VIRTLRGAEIEVFGFGSLCVMVEGRCALSSYATGQSPNTAGVCSPASAVRWDEAADGVRARLGGVLIDHYAPGEPRGYPTLCKGRFEVEPGQRDYALEEPTSLNTLAAAAAAHRHGRARDQDRGPPRGHQGVAQRHRRRLERPLGPLQRAAGLGRPWRASSTPRAPTTARGDE